MNKILCDSVLMRACTILQQGYGHCSTHTHFCEDDCVKMNTRLRGAAYWNSQLIKDRTAVVYFQTVVQRPETLVSCCLKGRNSLEGGSRGYRALRNKDPAPPQQPCHPSHLNRAALSIPPDFNIAEICSGWATRWEWDEKRTSLQEIKDLCLSAKT